MKMVIIFSVFQLSILFVQAQNIGNNINIYGSEISNFKIEEFPVSYDLRDFNRISQVRTQPNGGCWASAAMSTVESAWLTSNYKNLHLSAINLKLFHGFVEERNTNGNHYMSTAYFSRRSGPVVSSHETDSLFQKEPVTAATITDARYLPDNPSLIKQTIMKKGAVYSMMHFKQSLMDTINYTYYTVKQKINHAVTIIGWNDTITTGAGKGAWLAQNSLGKKFGDEGFFWISYEDENILQYNSIWNKWMDYDKQSRIYYYDTLGSFYSYGFKDTICYGLVKYTAEANLVLKALGTSVNFPNSKITSYIYKNFDDSLKILSGELSKTETKLCEYAGYYTIPISEPIEFKEGEDFYIMMRYITPNDTLPLPVETSIDGYSEPRLASDKCWINPDFEKWPDTWYECGANSPYENLKFNLCIKAYCKIRE